MGRDIQCGVCGYQYGSNLYACPRCNPVPGEKDPLMEPEQLPVCDSSVFQEALIGNRGPDQQRIAEEGLRFITTLLKKNADYGSSVWETPVLAPYMSRGDSILVRMSDKVKRINTLQLKKGPEVDESMEDSIRDLAAYGLLYLCRPQE